MCQTGRVSTGGRTGGTAGSGADAGAAADAVLANAVFRYRPRRLRIAAWSAAVVAVVAGVALAAALSGPVNSSAADGSTATFGLVDRAAVVGLGALGAGALLLLTRPMVEADAHGVRVRNIVGGCALTWDQVRAVRYDPGASCAVLELVDEELVGVVAVQAVDRARAVAAVRALRARHAAALLS